MVELDSVGLHILGCDLGVGAAETGEEGQCGGVGVSPEVIVHCMGVGVVHRGNDLLE